MKLEHGVRGATQGNRRTRTAKIARYAQSMRGRGLVRRKTATSCRTTRSSMSLAADVRPISRDQSEHLPEDEVQQPQRDASIMSDRRSPLVSAAGRVVAPQALAPVRPSPAIP
jgi:hypothetical protein